MSMNGRRLVCNLVADGLAAQAGVLIGDELITFNGSEVENEAALFEAMLASPDGGECVFIVSRKGDHPA